VVVGMVEVRLKWWKCRKNAQKTGPKKWVWGPPGRGVLRFWGGGIQESRSFLGQKRAKNQKSEQFRGWCNTTPGSLCFWSWIPTPALPHTFVDTHLASSITHRMDLLLYHTHSILLTLIVFYICLMILECNRTTI